MSNLLLIVLVAIVFGGLIWYSASQVPKWKKIQFDIIDAMNTGHNLQAIEEIIACKYNLTPSQARLCVNNYMDDSWFQLQSFLQD